MKCIEIVAKTPYSKIKIHGSYYFKPEFYRTLTNRSNRSLYVIVCWNLSFANCVYSQLASCFRFCLIWFDFFKDNWIFPRVFRFCFLIFSICICPKRIKNGWTRKWWQFLDQFSVRKKRMKMEYVETAIGRKIERRDVKVKIHSVWYISIGL